MSGQRLPSVALALLAGVAVLTAANTACLQESPASKSQKVIEQMVSEHPVKGFRGEIIRREVSSFAIGGYEQGANFTFETIRLQGEDGVAYRLVIPQPTSFAVGDKIAGEYVPTDFVTYDEVLDFGGNPDLTVTRGVYPLQVGGLEGDGLVTKMRGIPKR